MSRDHVSEHTKALFEQQVASLDGATAMALRARRQAALNRLPATRTPHWLPVGTAFAAVLALAVWLPRDAPENTPAPPSTVASVPEFDDAAFAAWAEDDALAEFEDDPEFYRWLAEAPIAADPNTAVGELL